jgi:hypothetical protein
MRCTGFPGWSECSVQFEERQVHKLHSMFFSQMSLQVSSASTFRKTTPCPP